MGKKLMTPEKKAHLAKLKRASRLRERSEQGTLSEAEKQELAALDSIPRLKGGRPKKRKDREDGTVEPQVVDEGEDGLNETPNRTPPPPPSVVEVIPNMRGDWRGRYRAESVGREAACVQVALLYTTILKRMSAYTAESGITPIMGEKEIDTVVFGAAVLTADKLLPDVDMGPEVQLALGSGLVISQACYAALKRKKSGYKAQSVPKEKQAPPEKSPPPPEQKVDPNGKHVTVAGVKVQDGQIF